MIMHFVPEVTEVDAQDDPFSTVDPFYDMHDPFFNERPGFDIETEE